MANLNLGKRILAYKHCHLKGQGKHRETAFVVQKMSRSLKTDGNEGFVH